MVWEFKGQEEPEEGWLLVDSDWGGGKERKSTSGGVWMLGGHCIKTWSASQGAYALSSAEAEASSRTAHHDAEMAAQWAAHAAYVEQATASSDQMADEIQKIGGVLKREREMREMERKGFQQACSLSKAQVQRLSDMNRAADMRIDELEATMRQMVTHADTEYGLLREYTSKVEKGAV